MKNNPTTTKINKKYKKWMSFYLFIVFIFFATTEISFIMHQGKQIRLNALKDNEEIYANIVEKYIIENQLALNQLDSLKSLIPLFPPELNLSLIDGDGNILYDNFIQDKSQYTNQNKEVEIKKAFIKGSGWNIRQSEQTGNDCVYYAVSKANYIIRISIPYTDEIKKSVRPDATSIIFIALLFVFVFFYHLYIFLLFNRSIIRLRDFVLSYSKDKSFPIPLALPDGELREIQAIIVNMYEELEIKKRDASIEREKLLEHIHFSEEGVSFFTPFFENIYTNSHFIQYLNILLNQPTIDVRNLFQSPVFSEVVQFLKYPEKRNLFTGKLHANGCHFFVRVIIFDDKSFEIIIRNISEEEENYRYRADITNNIAHELRTPVTSISACLETLITHENLNPQKRIDYLNRAYNQVIRLSEIIQDVVLLSKTADAPQYFSMEEINILDMLHELYNQDLKENIERSHCKLVLKVPENVIVRGNRTLLQSIFHNLSTNAIKYAGENITITINNYMEDREYYYFSFSDNGKGIEEKYLSRIFERFYRITEGRTREKGGSGLGLSIVKDAVSFHQGEIHAKNSEEGGLEFLFTIKKT
jgi:signal transduction histidine kinase